MLWLTESMGGEAAEEAVNRGRVHEFALACASLPGTPGLPVSAAEVSFGG